MRTRTEWLHTSAWMLTLAVCGCGNAQPVRRAFEQQGDAARAPAATRLVACTLVNAAEMSSIVGQSFTAAEAVDDNQSSSKCLYHSDANPAGASLDINWLSPSDYSDPVEHAALQKAAISGARLGGKLTASMTAPTGIRSGPVDGVGDEAYTSMGLLTARKGDVTIMVQVIPTDMMAFVTDTTVSNALLAHEKAVALKVISRI
jgi:hypothetical protein